MRRPIRLRRKIWQSHIRFVWVLHSTTLSSSTRCSKIQTKHAKWHAPHSKTPLLSLTTFKKTRTKILRLSCSSCVTTSRFGPPIKKEVSHDDHSSHYALSTKKSSKSDRVGPQF